MPDPKSADGAGKAAKPATTSKGAPAPADPPEVKAAATSPRARKAAAEKAAAPAKGVGKAAAKGKKAATYKRDEFPTKRGPDLRADLRDFAVARPGGWDHHDWLSFLDHLRERGHDTADADAIGLALERERLAVLLGQVPGMGPRRVQAVVERFDTVWSLHHADLDQIAAVPGMNLSLAEKVRQAIR